MQHIAHHVPDTLQATTTLTFQVTVTERRSNTATPGEQIASVLSIDSSDFFPDYAAVESVRFMSLCDSLYSEPLPPNLISQAEPAETHTEGIAFYTIPAWAQFGDSQVTVAFSGTTNLASPKVGALRSLRPASSLVFRFPECSPIPFSIDIPYPLTSSVACLKMTMDLREYLPKLDEAKAMVEEFKGGPEESCTPVAQLVLGLQHTVSERLENLSEHTAKEFGALRSSGGDCSIADEANVRLKNLDKETRNHSDGQLKLLRELLQKTPDRHPTELAELIEALIKAMAEPLAVSVLVDPRSTDIRQALATTEANEIIRLNEVEIPFTTERESGLHGSRSALSLAALGGLLLLMSTMNLGPVIKLLNWMSRHHWQLPTEPSHVPPIPAGEFATYTSAIVAVLVLFPMGLYFQVLQRRSPSRLGNHAQSMLLVTLSTLYMIPIVPAGLAASGRSSASVGTACFVGGVLVMTSSLVLISVYSAGSLEVSRLRIIRPPKQRWNRSRGET